MWVLPFLRIVRSSTFRYDSPQKLIAVFLLVLLVWLPQKQLCAKGFVVPFETCYEGLKIVDKIDKYRVAP